MLLTREAHVTWWTGGYHVTQMFHVRKKDELQSVSRVDSFKEEIDSESLMQIKYPLSKTLRKKSILDFRYVGVFEYLHVHDDTSLDPSRYSFPVLPGGRFRCFI